MSRIAFFGTPQVAVPSLAAFVAAADLEVVAVVCNPDRPRGRSRRLQPPPVKVAAMEFGLPVLQPARPLDVLAELADLRLDACAIVAYGAILPAAVLATGGRGFVNLHFSLLPRWRGAAPVQHAIRAGDGVTGATTFVLDEGMDTGPVLHRLETPIGPDETAGDLLERLAELGAPLLVESVRGLIEGQEPTPQPRDGATLAPKIAPEDVALDLSRPAPVCHDLVRSANPAPGAHTTFRGERLKVWRTGVVAGVDAPPGTVVVEGHADPVVACGEDALRLVEVQPAGKARMAGAAFANGYQPHGEHLGT